MHVDDTTSALVRYQDTGIILSIIPVIILVTIYYSISIENTDSIINYELYEYCSNVIVLCIQVLLHSWTKNLHVLYI